MRICAAQFRPLAGDIAHNLQRQLELSRQAAAQGIDLIVFPELSLTGYEPQLADSLALAINDPRLNPLQSLSRNHAITIAIGLPSRSPKGPQISLGIFEPSGERRCYAKQQLHSDELPYFTPGDKQLIIQQQGLRIAPAICYESLQFDHAQQAHNLGANIYLASVAKSATGMKQAYPHYSRIASHFNMPVIMANCHGPCDNFISHGSSAIWNNSGDCLGNLSNNEDGLIGYDSDSHQLIHLTSD
ncbi:MAG: carbon-nitrogen hydrolase family protein [Wenzhouxiangellaceae bacterium]